MTQPCPNECSGEPIPCWSPGGPCPPDREVCEMCGECAYCRTVADRLVKEMLPDGPYSGLDPLR